MSLVQEPGSAKYDGTPSSAIQHGVATHVLPVGEMPTKLLLDTRQHTDPAQSAHDISTNLVALRSSTGHDFSQYKKTTIRRRIARRMAFHQIESVPVYTRYLNENPAEMKILFQELLINVTRFFRDIEVFKLLKEDILPTFFKDRREADVFRVWIAGCASGEEAYSIAIIAARISGCRPGVY